LTDDRIDERGIQLMVKKEPRACAFRARDVAQLEKEVGKASAYSETEQWRLAAISTLSEAFISLGIEPDDYIDARIASLADDTNPWPGRDLEGDVRIGTWRWDPSTALFVPSVRGGYSAVLRVAEKTVTVLWSSWIIKCALKEGVGCAEESGGHRCYSLPPRVLGQAFARTSEVNALDEEDDEEDAYD
jgi:hypothetical protein